VHIHPHGFNGLLLAVAMALVATSVLVPAHWTERFFKGWEDKDKMPIATIGYSMAAVTLGLWLIGVA
jgi:hypothetical protein